MTKRLTVFFEYTLFILLLAFSMLLAFGKNYNSAVTDGLKLWVACVIPSLFPYFFITAILSSLSVTKNLSNKLTPLTKNLFNTSGATGYAFFMSLISGYPVGAKTVSDLKKSNLISNAEAVRASAFCSTSSPMFLISSVGGFMFENKTFGFVLFLVHLLSAILTGVIFSFYKRKEKFNPPKTFNKNTAENLLYESVYSAVTSVLIVGGLITVFYLLTEVLFSLKVLSPIINLFSTLFNDQNISKGIVFGLFECTKGLKELSLSGINFYTLPICAFLSGFGGLSVIMQSLAYLKSAKIKTAPFILAKLTMAVIGFILGLILSFIFGI